MITFGYYEQDNNLDNGPEPIEWIVLDVQDGKALLLSKYGLDAKLYNDEFADVTWEACTLRTWLNSDFLNAAFSETEQRVILLTDVDNSDDQGFDWTTIVRNQITGGNNTQDFIFLLSYAEANRYLGVIWEGDSNTKSRVTPTAYAMANGARTWNKDLTADGEPAGWWWLRSPGYNQSNAAYVHSGGSLGGRNAYSGGGVARPALWANLESDKSTTEPAAEVSAETPAEPTAEPTAEPISDKLDPTPYKTVGSIVTFGRYEQDNDLTDGQEPIEWIVMDYDEANHRALLLSRYGLDAKPYNTEYVDITWEQCSIRVWLNKDFLKASFSETEQSAIMMTHVDNSNVQGDSEWDTIGGNDTEDQIFLLSFHEAFELYFINNKARMCASTDYAIANGAYTWEDYQVDGKLTGVWWLRSPGSNQTNAKYVSLGGNQDSCPVDYVSGIVRPALWLNLKSDIF